MITPRQVFIGISISVGLYLLTFVGLWEWVPYAFMSWYIFLKDWSKTNENSGRINRIIEEYNNYY